MRRRFRTSTGAWLAAGCVASLVSCLHGAPDSALPGGGASSSEPSSEVVVSPARLFPDVGAGSSGVVSVEPDGSRRIIVAGIRVLDHPDGSMQRAREILPNGMARVVTLPSRLGG